MPDPGSSSSAEREAAFFDGLVDREGSYEPFAAGAWRTLGARLAVLLPEATAPLAVLEIGCGTGASEKLYRPFARSYVGIDLSLVALAAARHAMPGTRWLRADAAA